MKQFYTLLFIVIYTSINAQNLVIEDSAFKNVLVNTNCVTLAGNNTPTISVDTNNDGEIQQEEADAVLKLTIDNIYVTSIEGIENFHNLESLNCTNTQLSDVDLSAIPSLISIDISYNTLLTNINVNGLYNLDSFYCMGNDLITVDASQCSAETFDFSENPNLTNINLRNGVINDCITLLAEGVDYTCAMFLNLPSLESVCLDDDEIDSYHTSYPQENVQFRTNCTMGIDEKTANHYILYPNPAHTSLTIQNETDNIEEIKIYNLLGQIVNQLTTGNKIETIDISSLQPGTYFAEIITSHGKSVNKFIKI